MRLFRLSPSVIQVKHWIGFYVVCLLFSYGLFYHTALANHTFTFGFDTTTESWNFTSDNGICTGSFTGATGNPSGSLQTTGTKSGGGGQSCSTYWEWQGTWEDLGVPAGHEVTSIDGSYQYAVSADNSNGSWGTGALEFQDGVGTLRATLVPALTGQTGTSGFTTRSDTPQTFTAELSNTQIRLRINTSVTFGGGNRNWTGQIDTISLAIEHQPVLPPPPPPQDLYQAGFFQGSELVSGQTNLNVATPTPLVWNTSTAFDTTFLNYDVLNPSRVTILEPGDYFLNLTIPITSSCGATGVRNAIQAEVWLNGVKQDVGVGRSSYIRNTTGHCESSVHLTTMLPSLALNDYLEILVIRTTNNTTNTLTSNTHSLYLEYVSNKSVFHAKATQTSSTNLNLAADTLIWNPVRSDAPYTYNPTPRTISLDEGFYTLSVSIPIQGTVTRGNILGRIRINGTTIDGGTFNQGYIRNTNTHTQSSIHWSGVVEISPGDEIDITVEQDAAAGTITTGGEQAAIYIQQVPTTGLYINTAATVGGGTNLNPTTKSTVDWGLSPIIDTASYSTPNSQSITVLQDGDYHLSFNGSYSATVVRANPKLTVQVNGVDVIGAEVKSGYIRSDSGHNRSSNSLHTILPNLSAGDTITLSKQAEAGTGTVSATTPMRLSVRKLDTTPPFLTLIGHRFFENLDSLDVGTPLTNQNTDLELTIPSTPFRLRLLLRSDVADLPQNSEFRLEVAPETTSCDPLDTSYQPVSLSTPIAFYSNPSASSGDPLTSNINDPVDGIRTIQPQIYTEQNPFSNALSSIPSGDTALWDVALIDNTPNTSTTYCLRLINNDGTDLDSYGVVPKVRTAPSGVVATFPFATSTEGWSFTTDNGICTGTFSTVSGNPSGSLDITGTKGGGGGQSCNTYWEWQGTWEDLGIPINSTITSVQGSYQYSVTADNSGGTWTTGALSLRDSFGLLQQSLVSSLPNQTGTVAFTTRSGSPSILNEPSSTPIRFRIDTSVTFGGGNRSWAGLLDTIQLQIEYSGNNNPEVLTLSLSEASVGFGELSPSETRYATTDGFGTNTETVAHSITTRATAPNGYEVLYQGDTLTCISCDSQNTISPILTTPEPATIGVEQFGLKATINTGNATLSGSYSTSDWLFAPNNTQELLYTGTGDNTDSQIDLSYVANVEPQTEAGEYQTIITFVIVGRY